MSLHEVNVSQYGFFKRSIDVNEAIQEETSSDYEPSDYIYTSSDQVSLDQASPDLHIYIEHDNTH